MGLSLAVNNRLGLALLGDQLWTSNANFWTLRALPDYYSTLNSNSGCSKNSPVRPDYGSRELLHAAWEAWMLLRQDAF